MSPSQEATRLMLESGLLVCSVLSGPPEEDSQESMNGTLNYLIQVIRAVSSIKEGKGQSSCGFTGGAL